MAVERDKVLAAIELRYKGKSMSKTFKENLAAKYAAKIDNDTEIDSYIEDREDIVLEAISEADRRATDAAKKNNAPPKDDNEPPKQSANDDAPAWFKTYAENQKKEMEALSGKVATFETAQTAKTLEQRFKSDERLKGVPEVMFKGRIPKTEEEFESAVTELASDYAPLAEQMKKSTFGTFKPAGGSEPSTGAKKQASKEQIDAIKLT